MRAHPPSAARAALPWLFLVVQCLGCSGASSGSALTLKSVVLYQNGIGYFEHRGQAPGAYVDLSFRRHEIGDVLKTITVIPVGAAAGTASAVVALTTSHAAGSTRAEASAGASADGATADAAASDGQESADRVALHIALSAAAPDLAIAYAVPTAAWKPTYRVVLPERGEGPALVQGFAMINNTSDMDWRQVSLTLATGAPLSFAIDLLTPTFVARPDLSGTLVEPVIHGVIGSGRMASGDADGDGLKDVDDLCPDSAEDMDGFEDGDGCPDPDNDHDRVLDVGDMCPGEPETYNGLEDEDGCPDRGRVVVTDSYIEILDNIYFTSGSAKVKPESWPIVDAVAATLLGNPDIASLAVQGHAASNEKDAWGLSRRRAGAVERALRDRGVATELVVEPYGATQPIRPGDDEDARARNRRVSFLILRRNDQGARPANQPAMPAITRAAARTSVKTQVEARDVAGSVRYRIAAPVTIERGASALVPIINEDVPGEDIFLFRPEGNAPASERHPWRAARVINQTELELQPGPVAIFARGAFVGEGLIERLYPRETVYIPYALDSSCTVRSRESRAQEPVRIVSARRHEIEVEDRDVITTRYEVRVGAKAPARILIRHARATGYEGVDLAPHTRDDGDVYMVPLPIQAGKTSVIEVVEKKTTSNTIDLEFSGVHQLARYVDDASLPADVRQALEQVIALGQSLEGLEEEAGALREQLVDVGERADEIRASLTALGAVARAGGDPKTAALRKTLLAGLAETTRKSEAIGRDLAARSATLAEMRVRFAESVRALSYTRAE